MAENQTELKQQDVFSYIDRELKKDRKSFAERIIQKTKSNFMIVMMVNLIAIFVASVGFYTVYTFFSERAYNLVGSEKSIKGLEDVLFAEMQKKANAELLKQQEEMKKIQAELNKLSSQMDDFKTEQIKKQKAELDKMQNDLKAKFEADSKNKTEAEKNALKKEYELEIASQQKAIEQAAKQKEAEYQKMLQAEKTKLLEQEKDKKVALQSAETKLTEAQSELQSLQEEKAKTAAVLKEFETAKEEQKKIDIFNDQVAVLFQSAVDSFQGEKYDLARQKLNAVIKLYDNKPQGVTISKSREVVDKFFVNAISDYLALKENKAGESQQQLEQTIIALKDLRDLSKDIQGGAYNTKEAALKNKINAYQASIPEVVAFANAYEKYFDSKQKSQPSALDLNIEQANSSAAPLFNSAKSLYASKSYDSAIKNLKTVIAEYPTSKYTKEALSYFEQIYKDQIADAGGKTVDIEAVKAEQTKNSGGAYSSAKKYEKEGDWEKAKQYYTRVISDYPLSAYADKSITGLENSIGEIEKKKAIESSGSIDKIIEEQNSSASGLVASADKLLKNGKLNDAQKAYAEIIINYPLSKYTGDSLDGYKTAIEKIEQAKSSGTVDLTEIKKEQNKGAKDVFAKAASEEKAGKLDSAKSKYMQVISEYPLSDYVEGSMKGFEKTVAKIAEQSKPSGIDLTELKKTQNKEAKDLFAKAAADEKAGKLDSAKSKYADIISEYPLSDYVEGSMKGFEKTVAKIAEQSKPSGVDLTELKKTQNKEAKDLYAKAAADEKAGKLDSAKSKYADIISEYPLSDYVEGSMKGFEKTVAKITEQSKPSGVDLNELKKTQNKEAKDLYAKASADEKSGKYASAKEKYAGIITQFPLSDYVGGSVDGIERVVAIEEKAKASGSVDLAKIKSEQNTAAKPLFDQASASESSKNYTDAKAKYIQVIVTYPISDYLKGSVEGLERVLMIEGAKSAGLSIAELKAQHNKSAKDEFAKVEEFYKKKEYDKAKQGLVNIMTLYPLSDYIDKSIEKLESIVIVLNAEKQQTAKVQEENYQEKAVGRVVDVIGNEIILDVYKGKTLSAGQTIFIYRKDEKSGIIYIGEANVSVVSPIMSKAQIVKKNEPIKVGDILYRK